MQDGLPDSVPFDASYPGTSATPGCSPRKRLTSFAGALPKKRLYSRLNWDALTYPTRRPAAPASSMVVSMRRLAV